MKRIETIQEVRVCAVCQATQQELNGLQSLPGFLISLFLLIGLPIALAMKAGVPIHRLVDPQSLAVGFAVAGCLVFFVLPAVTKFVSGVWLSFVYRDHPFSGFTWLRYSEVPSDLIDGCPVFQNPDYQELYERENPLVAKNRKLAGKAKSFLGYGLAIFLLLLAISLVYTILVDRKYEPSRVAPAKASDPRYRNIRKPNANFGPAMRRKRNRKASSKGD